MKKESKNIPDYPELQCVRCLKKGCYLLTGEPMCKEHTEEAIIGEIKVLSEYLHQGNDFYD